MRFESDWYNVAAELPAAWSGIQSVGELLAMKGGQFSTFPKSGIGLTLPSRRLVEPPVYAQFHKPDSKCLLAVGALLCAHMSVASPPLDSVKLSACKLTDSTLAARCGVLQVAENPERPAGRRLHVRVAVVPATGGRAFPDPIVVLMGGPGESAIDAAGLYTEWFKDLLQNRDLLLIDQRGTGQSGALRCQLYSSRAPQVSLRDVFPTTAVHTCEGQLRTRADLTQYGYSRFATDLERVRKALHYEPVNIFAGSYGTRAAQVYIRAFPHSVRTAYLGSAVPLDVATPRAMAKTAEGALESMFEACRAEPACNAAYPSARDEFRQVFARLEEGTVRVSVPGIPDILLLYRGRVAAWVRSKLYRPSSAAILPWAIHHAFIGDFDPIVQGILAETKKSDLSFGLFFSITCSEDVPFLGEAESLAESKGTFLGDYRVRQQKAACDHWPRAALSSNYRNPVQSAVPTLFVTGGDDGGTPVWYTDDVMKGFSNSHKVVIGGQGHTEWNACVAALFQELVRSGSVSGLGGSACQPVPRPRFKTD
jgi:pimeloyl-ACP methyl ester carboxylesterase